MFRNFYAEQNMADPRDSWYKPNLLYNIHYRPPKPPTPPKMTVVTRKFNPSVCTCGKHGCKPHYRMEREVVWSNKEVKDEENRERKEKVKSERDKRKAALSNKEVKEGESELKEKVKPESDDRKVVMSNKEVKEEGDRELKEKAKSERDDQKSVLSNKEVKSKESIELKEMIHDKKDVTTKVEYDGVCEEDGDSDDNGHCFGESGEEMNRLVSSEEKVNGIKGMVYEMNGHESGRLTGDVPLRLREHGIDRFDTYGESKSCGMSHEMSGLEQQRNSLMMKSGKLGLEWKQSDINTTKELEKVRNVMDYEWMKSKDELEYDEMKKRERTNSIEFAECSSSENSKYDTSLKVDGASNGVEVVQCENDAMVLGQNSDDAVIEENSYDHLPRFDDFDEPDFNESPSIIDGDEEDFGSAFGIMRVYCDSELHTTWNGVNELKDY